MFAQGFKVLLVGIGLVVATAPARAQTKGEDVSSPATSESTAKQTEEPVASSEGAEPVTKDMAPMDSLADARTSSEGVVAYADTWRELSSASSGYLAGGLAVGFRLTSLEGQEEIPAVSLFIETHYVFPLNSKNTIGVGPFVAIQPDKKEFIAAGALGALFALRYSEKSNNGFAIGLGALVSTKTEMEGMQTKSSPVVSPIIMVAFRFL